MNTTSDNGSKTDRSMYDRMFQKQAGPTRNTNGETERGPDEADATDDLGAFGWLRGIRDRALCLELRKKTGAIVAVPYMTIDKYEYDPTEGITIHTAGETVRIKGRNLNAEVQPMKRLYDGLVRARVPWVQETNRQGAFEADKSATVIESLEW